MKGKQFTLNLFHKRKMVVVEFRLSSFEVAIVDKLPEIQIVPGKAFIIHQSLREVLGLIEESDLRGQLTDFFLHFVLLSYKFFELNLCLHQYFKQFSNNATKINQQPITISQSRSDSVLFPINKIMISELKLASILQRPLSSQHWPNLESIMKILNDYINQCIKNRQYIEAQKAKEKISEVQQQIKKRNRNDIEMREKRAAEDMMRKHQEEANRLNKEWEVNRRKIDLQYEEFIAKKMEKQELEKEKHLQQIEIALPLNASPDKEMFQLRHEEEEFVRMGNFIEAQRIKVEISKREQDLSTKNQKLRESNIRIMMNELESKHMAEIQIIQAKRDEKRGELDKKRKKRQRQMLEKQDRELKELHWIYGEEKKRFK